MKTLKLPGLVDPHVHLRDPGQTEKEDFYTGTSAALAGGYTTIIDMPNNKQLIDSEKLLDEKMAGARKKIVCDVGFHFGSLGDNLDELEKVKNKVFGLKLFLSLTTGGYIIDKNKLKDVFKSWQKDKLILVHAEDKTIEEVINLMQKLGNRVHVCHVTNRFELTKVMEAKEKGLPITCGVTPHHLFLTENDLHRLSSFGFVKPPLQSREDVDFLWKNIQAIDCVESDHAPHTVKEKQTDNPTFGVPGLETTLPLLLTAMREDRITLDDIIRLCHNNPKQIFLKHYNLSHYSEVEIDLDAEWEITNEGLFTKCKWSPFAGWKVKGRVIKVTIRGRKVYENNTILAQPGSGTVLYPKHSMTGTW